MVSAVPVTAVVTVSCFLMVEEDSGATAGENTSLSHLGAVLPTHTGHSWECHMGAH